MLGTYKLSVFSILEGSLSLSSPLFLSLFVVPSKKMDERPLPYKQLILVGAARTAVCCDVLVDPQRYLLR